MVTGEVFDGIEPISIFHTLPVLTLSRAAARFCVPSPAHFITVPSRPRRMLREPISCMYTQGKFFKKVATFSAALATKTGEHGGVSKGGCPPFRAGFEGAQPLAAFQHFGG